MPWRTGTQGHPKLAVSGRRLFAVWDEALDGSEPEPASSSSTSTKGHGHHHGPDLSGGGRAIMLAVSTEDGASFSTPRAVAPRAGAFQLNPALVVAADGTVLIAWNELDTQGKRDRLHPDQASRGFGFPRPSRQPMSNEHPVGRKRWTKLAPRIAVLAVAAVLVERSVEWAMDAAV